jgi:hypothetical protein
MSDFYIVPQGFPNSPHLSLALSMNVQITLRRACNDLNYFNPNWGVFEAEVDLPCFWWSQKPTSKKLFWGQSRAAWCPYMLPGMTWHPYKLLIVVGTPCKSPSILSSISYLQIYDSNLKAIKKKNLP